MGKIPGDVNKGVDRMIEIDKGTGMAAGKNVELTPIKAKCKETLKVCEEGEEITCSTDTTSLV